MADVESPKKLEVLRLIQENPFISQQDIARRLEISRSAVASHISSLTKDGTIIGRAYVLQQSTPVLCIGGANVDRKIQTITHIEYGTSNPSTVATSHGGVARNIAENLARLGLPPALCTMVGLDKEGEMLLSYLERLGVDVHHAIRSSNHRTGTYTAVLDVDGNLAVALADMEIYDDFQTVPPFLGGQGDMRYSHIVVDTNLPADTMISIIEQSRELDAALYIAPVSVPKAKRLPESLHGVDTILGNAEEIGTIARHPVDTLADLEQASVRLQQRGCKHIIATRGQEGVAWLDHDGHFGTLSVTPIQPEDVTGAGDAFVAGYVYATTRGLPIPQACDFASKLSRLTLQTKETVSTDITASVAREWIDESRKRSG